MAKLATVFPRLLEKLTGHRRYQPEIKWSSDSWVHNIFRVYELIFWRRVGIRAESSVTWWEEKGEIKYTVELYTFEAVCAHTETLIRRFFEIKWLDIKLVNLQFALPVNTPELRLPWISFAIALDTSTTSTAGTTSPKTWTHIVTGSNPLIALGGATGGTTQPTFTAASYNSVAATQAVAKQYQIGAGTRKFEVSIYLLANPATGSHTASMSATLGTSPGIGGNSTSYTGCQSSSTADATGSTSDTTSGMKTVNITTVAANCWIYALGCNEAAFSPTMTAGQTSRGSLNITMGGISNVMRAEDTNGTVSAGVNTMTMTAGGTSVDANGIVAASFAPASSPDVTINASVQSATFSTPAPSIKFDFSVAIAVLGVVANLIAPAVIPETKVSAAAQSAAFSIQAPSLSLGVTTTPSVQSATFSTQAPTLNFDFTVSPGVQSATFATQAPTVQTDQVISLGVQQATFSTQSPVVSLGATASPSPQSVTFSLQTPSLFFDYAVNPNVLSGTFSTQSLTVQVSATISPAIQQATFSIPSVAVVTVSDVTVSPAVQDSTFSIPALSVSLGAIVLPAVQTATFNLVSPTVSAAINVTIQLNAETAVFSTQTITLKYDYILSVNVLSAVFSIPTVHVPLWGQVPRSSDASWNLTSRSSDASYNGVSRSSDASYNQASRSSDANYNQVARSSDDGWIQVTREP